MKGISNLLELNQFISRWYAQILAISSARAASRYETGRPDSLIFNTRCIFSGSMYRSYSSMLRQDHFLCSWWLWHL